MSNETVFTLEAMHVDVFVLRDAEVGVPGMVAANVGPHVSVLSAGEAHLSHPTQGLLDALTVLQRKGQCDGLSIAIVGDIRHSRVARSALHGLRALGAGDLRVCGPAELMPESVPGAEVFDDVDRALEGADVVMALRLQKERMAQAMIPGEAEYFRRYGLTAERMRKAARDAIVMHPGPMNRGVEIDSDVADGPWSVILDQVANGVAVRMAVLYLLAGGDEG